MDERAFSVVELAEGYPYDLREDAFLFQHGHAHPFELDALAGRTPVLAIGSNGAPSRLRRKFGAEAIVPVQPARLHDHAVVYAAAITSYGSVPATLVPSPGADALVAVTFLDEAQLATMHESESVGRNYEIVDLVNDVWVDGRPLAVLAYRSLRGALHINGQPVRLAEVPTIGTPFGAAFQSGILALLHHRFARPDETYPAFIADLVSASERRHDVMAALAAGIATTRRGDREVGGQKPASGSLR